VKPMPSHLDRVVFFPTDTIHVVCKVAPR
ncbi:MAG: hypothetical protein RLZZ50_1974, partial [Verrucomicrobiota bacterium]